VKSNINSIEVHPPLSNNRHEVDGALVGIGSLWPILSFLKIMNLARKEEKEKTFIQVRCKIHTLNENRSMVMYPLNT
jgi:hypothetical protein